MNFLKIFGLLFRKKKKMEIEEADIQDAQKERVYLIPADRYLIEFARNRNRIRSAAAKELWQEKE